MSEQMPFSSDMSDTQFRRVRGRFADLLEANPKAHADVETVKQVAIDAGVTSEEMSAITIHTWAFLVQCAAYDADRCVYFGYDDKPVTRFKTVERCSGKQRLLWFLAGAMLFFIDRLTDFGG